MRIVSGILILFFLMTGYNDLWAQQTGGISGTVRAFDSRPVEAATVSLLKARDSSLVKISVSNNLGNYEFEKLKKGIYLLRVTAVGQLRYVSSPVSLITDTSRIRMTDIGLERSSSEMDVIRVTATKPLVENKIDR